MHFRMAWFSSRTRAVFTALLAFFVASIQAAPAPGTARKPVREASPKATPAPARPVRATPKKQPSARAEGRPAAPVESAPPPEPGHQPVFADAWPSEIRVAPADLQLKPEDTRKAEALSLFAQGLVAEDNADQEGMLDAYRRAIELDPTNAELAVKVAYELARRNDVSAGIQVLKDAIKAAPKEPLPYIYLSQLYANNLKKPDLALKYAEQALALAPGNFKAHLAIYELQRASGQPRKAEAVLDAAIQSASTDTQFWIDLGAHLQKLYLKDDGSCTPEEQKRMNAVYEKLAKLGADDAVALAKVADYYVLSKQVREAIPHYMTVLKLRPGNNDPLAGDVREKLARSLLFTQQRDEAIAIFEQIAKDFPQRFETYELLGELYEQKGDLDKALEYYQHSLTLDASEPGNHVRIAQLLGEAKRYDKAVEILQAACRKFSDLPRLTFRLALALSQAQRHEEALKTFAEAQTGAENRDEEMLNALFYFSYGSAAEQGGQFEKAVELLKQSLELDPNSSWAERPGLAANYLGYSWVDRGERIEEAGDLIKKAVELDPENGAYLDSLGWYYFKKGDAERALRELLRAQENILREDKKDDPTVLDHIADAYAKLGKTPEALTYWQKALALQPEDKKLAAKITEKLEAAKQKMTSGTPIPEPAKQ
jgi:tetratricopeptide (TPR) repeat protein